MTATRKPLALALIGLALTGCGKWADDLFCASAGCAWNEGEWARVAALANPGPPAEDLSNALRNDPYARLVGQALFFDPDFSGSATQVDAIKRMSPPARAAQGQPLAISCASCHDLARAGVDTTSAPGHVSVGAGWTDVNALPVVNSAYRPIVSWNGRADSLWALNVLVAESATTMNGNRLRTAHLIVDKYLRLGFWPPEPGLLAELERLMKEPFGCAALLAAIDEISALPLDGKPGMPEFDGLGERQQRLVNSLLVIWAKAIAAYEYTLTSVDSPFDRFVRAGASSELISPAAKRGARLFVGKAACVDCHNGPQLTDEQFHNIGIPQAGLAVPQTTDCPQGNATCDCSADHADRPCAPWGAYDGLTKLQSSAVGKKWSRNSAWSDYPTDDTSSAYFNRALTDDLKGAWRTPSLRNVALTAPYMHDGRYATLQDVVWHYNTGGASAGPEQVGARAAQIKPLLLTEAEQADLVAFLETLTGEPLPASQIVAPGLPPRPPPTCSGAGGSGGGTPPRGCEGTRVTSPLITDFGDATADSPPRFGLASNIAGSSFSYAAPGLAPPVLSTAQGINGTPALKVAVNTGAPTDPSAMWFGFGLSFESCLDLKPFDAVQFTITGDVVACPIRFGVASSQTVNHDNDPRGTCRDASCYPPSVPIPGPGTVLVPLSNLMFPGSAFPGNPNLVDPGSVIGIQWQMDAPGAGGCTASLQIDDVTLVNTGASTGTGGRSPPPSGAGGVGGGTGGIATGAGGSGGGPPPLPVRCSQAPPSGPLITDFTQASGANPVVFTSPSGIAGWTFSYGPPGVTTPGPVLGPGLNGTTVLRFATRAAPPPGAGFYGFGLTFDECVDARAFFGVRFALDDMAAATCPVEVAVTSRQNVTAAEDPRGTCPVAGACSPQFLTVPQAGLVTVPLPPMSVGFEPGALLGVQWRVPASCSAMFAVDDIAFVTGP